MAPTRTRARKADEGQAEDVLVGFHRHVSDAVTLLKCSPCITTLRWNLHLLGVVVFLFLVVHTRSAHTQSAAACSLDASFGPRFGSSQCHDGCD